MNSFLDLQAIDSRIDIEMTLESTNGDAKVIINNKIIYQGPVENTKILNHCIDLLDPVDFEIHHRNVSLSSLTFDGWQARPEYAWEIDGIFTLKTQLPFYQWLHTATGQGWLLRPC